MRTLTNFWRTLEDIRTLAAVEDEWKFRIGDEYELARPFLRPARVRAASYPQLDGGPPYEVVRHGEDEIVGVCPESGRRLVLRESQLIVYELDRRRLAQGIANAFGIETAGANEESEGRVIRLGRIVLAELRLDCYFIIPTESTEVDFAVLRLVADRRSPFILLCPTWRRIRDGAITRVRQHGSCLITFTESLGGGKPGILQPASPLASFIPKDQDGGEPSDGARVFDDNENVFRFEEATWTLRFAGKTIHLPPSQGLLHIAHLLASKGRDVDAAALKAAAMGRAPVKPLVGIEMLDAEAHQNYESTYRRLSDELEDARELGDLSKQETIEEEIAFLARELESATGMGGRSRKVKDEAARVRTSVTNAITRTIDNQIYPKHPALAAHLDQSIRTGTLLCYNPATDVSWNL